MEENYFTWWGKEKASVLLTCSSKFGTATNPTSTRKACFPGYLFAGYMKEDLRSNRTTRFISTRKVITGKDKLDVPANVQDMLSSFYYARTIDFSNAKIDDEFEINCVVDGETWPLKIKYKGEDVVKIKKGKIQLP